MRERASLVGGRLEAGPRLGGGYAVRAWLPLEPARSPSRDVVVTGHAPPRRHRRRPGPGPRRVPDDPRGAAGHRGRRRGGRRRGGRPTDAAPPTRRRPDGHPDAGPRRARGDATAPRAPPPTTARRGTPPRIVILTTFDLDEYVYAALQAGASGFPAQGRLAGASRRRRADRRDRRRAPRPIDHAPPRRALCAAAGGARLRDAGGSGAADRTRDRGLQAARARA